MPRTFCASILTALTVLFCAAGCATKNYSTSLRADDGSIEALEAKFRVNHVDALPPLIFYMSGFTDSEYWAEKIPDVAMVESFPQQLRDRLAGTFPALFTDTPEALPLDVRIAVSDFHESSTGSSILTSSTWGIFGIILPLPIAMKYTCEVQVSIPACDIRQQVTFRNRLRAWISFPSPLALIPLPAAADRRALGMYPFQTRYYSGRLFTLESIAHAVIQALAACDPAALNRAYRTHLDPALPGLP